MPYPYPYGETVTWVTVSSADYDDFGNPVETRTTVDIPHVAVQPTGSTETQEDYRNPVVTGFTLHLSPQSIKGMKSDDEIHVRGFTTHVQGNPQAGVWIHPMSGTVMGASIQVKIFEEG